MRFILTILCTFITLLSLAIGPDDVKTVQLYPTGNEVGLPIIGLQSGESLQLEFDILGDDAPYLYYEIQHFSADWSEKDLNPLDFAKGFQTGNIDVFEFSFNTNQNYTHYEFSFPNDQLTLKVSGNYRVLVFEENADEPILEERFFVTEQMAQIDAVIKNAVSGSQLDSHHQIDFLINTEALLSNNPRQEFSAMVFQNFRMDNALSNLTPNRLNGNLLYFNNPFKYNMEAGNEFRWFNTRSVRYKTDGVAEIIRKNGRTDVWLIPALARQKAQFLVWDDFNGQFVVDHQEGNRPDIDGDYVYVHFTLKEEAAFKGKDVYVYGGLTNWEVNDAYKLEMNNRQNLLESVMYLKQGNYDYQFLVKEADGYSVKSTEGNFYRTENQYTVLVYYKPFGARYDRLVGVRTLNSRF